MGLPLAPLSGPKVRLAMPVTLDDVRAAQRLIAGRVSRTPFNRARTLDAAG